jgi:hypothetical protein
MDFWQIGDSSVWKTIFASHAPRTTTSYTSTFAKFVIYLRDSGHSVRSAQIHHVLQFLQTSVDANRAGSTLRSHIAAISFYLKLFDRSDLVDHPLLRSLPLELNVWRLCPRNEFQCGIPRFR